jgi:phosphoglycerate dehydrogenase-like enzyme
MRVVGVTSAPRSVAGFDAMVHRDRLEDAVRAFDYLVLLTPYSPATHCLVDERILGAMKKNSYLLNLARGGVVDEAALVRALDAGTIAGAALDVFGTEPLPADSPIWTTRNVIVTAHQGGFHDGYPASALPVIEENLRRFLRGDTQNMINIVQR